MAGFFDSNIILYSTSSDIAKAEISDALITGGGWISVQVLNEVANVSRRKMGYEWSRTCELLLTIRASLDVLPVTIEIHETGIGIAERYQISVYDSMIVAAALACDCDMLYSEDMHPGMVVDGRLRIVNPFLAGD